MKNKKYYNVQTHAYHNPYPLKNKPTFIASWHITNCMYLYLVYRTGMYTDKN